MIMSFDEVQDKLPSIVIVADGAPTKASKGGSQVGPVLLRWCRWVCDRGPSLNGRGL